MFANFMSLSLLASAVFIRGSGKFFLESLLPVRLNCAFGAFMFCFPLMAFGPEEIALCLCENAHLQEENAIDRNSERVVVGG